MQNYDYMIRKARLTIFLTICCIFSCGCTREIPINEKPMYGDILPLPEVQKANEEFIARIEKQGGREYGAKQMIELAWGYCKKGDLVVAMKRFNQAWLLNPSDPEIYFGLAYIAAKKNNLDESINMNSRAISLDSNYAIAYSNRGIDYLHRGISRNNADDIESAISDFTKAIEINPRDAQNYNDRATCYAMMGEYNKSWSDLDKARELGYKVNPEFIAKIKKAIKSENSGSSNKDIH
jgi:tetratricopeptide (TPR) repeat protein